VAGVKTIPDNPRGNQRVQSHLSAPLVEVVTSVLKRKHGGCRAQSGVGAAVSRVGRHVLGLQPGSSAEVAEHPCLTHSIVPSRVDRGDKMVYN
jgi:hypothetical protein